jgi:serine protease AprX
MPSMRIRAFVDLINGKTAPYDDNGHGTAVCGLCAGNGLVSGGKKSVGYAKAGLVVIKALNERGEGSALKILEAMQWIYDHRHRYGIRVACMSLGCKPSSPDALSLGARALWRAGVTVVASAGNLGPKPNSVTSPGVCPEIITVGAFCKRNGKLEMADFSSRGAKNSVKPELLADGVEVSVAGNREHYTVMSGTSVAAPRVAALAARILAQNPDYTPDRVKEVLLERSERQPSPPPYGIIAD